MYSEHPLQMQEMYSNPGRNFNVDQHLLVVVAFRIFLRFVELRDEVLKHFNYNANVDVIIYTVTSKAYRNYTVILQ